MSAAEHQQKQVQHWPGGGHRSPARDVLTLASLPAQLTTRHYFAVKTIQIHNLVEEALSSMFYVVQSWIIVSVLLDPC